MQKSRTNMRLSKWTQYTALVTDLSRYFVQENWWKKLDSSYLHQYLSSQHQTTLKSIANVQSIVSSLQKLVYECAKCTNSFSSLGTGFKLVRVTLSVWRPGLDSVWVSNQDLVEMGYAPGSQMSSMTFTTDYYVYIWDSPSILSTNVWYVTSTACRTIVT